jgi:serine/threonine-protein kinase RsbW
MTSSPANEVFGGRFVLASRSEDLVQFEEQFLPALERAGYDPSSVFAVRLALEEAFNNAVQHGSAGRTDARISIVCSVTPDQVTMEVEDEGDGFDPDRVPDPTADENLEIPSGRGIMLIQAYMSEVEFIQPGNRIRMVYRKPVHQR